MCSLSLILIAFRCDFVAPHRIIEPPSSNINDSEAKEPSVATSLKVLEPPSSLQRLADYRKKMMIDVEGPVAPASVSGSDSTVSMDICDEQVLPLASPGVIHTQTETERTEHPNSPMACTLVPHLCEPTPLPSDGRKLDLEAVSVCLPAAIVVPSKVTQEPVNTELAHEQDVESKRVVRNKVTPEPVNTQVAHEQGVASNQVVPNKVTPEPVNTQVAHEQGVAPKQVVPSKVTPEPVNTQVAHEQGAPKRVVPNKVTPEPVNTQVAHEQGVAPKQVVPSKVGVVPKCVVSRKVTPKPVNTQLAHEQGVAPKRVVPSKVTPEPVNTQLAHEQGVAPKRVVPSKVTPEPVNTQLAREQGVAPKPELAVTVPVSMPVPTSLVDSVSDAPVVFRLEEPAVCSAVDMGTNDQKQLNSCNVFASLTEVQKIVELPAESRAFLTGEDLSPSVCSRTSIVPSPSSSLLIEATSKKTNTVPVRKGGCGTKSLKRKPVVTDTDNPLTNYFRPVSIILTADDDEVDASRTKSARTIHLNVKNSDNDRGTVAADETKRRQHTLEAAQLVPEHRKVLEECPPLSLPCAEVKITTKVNDETCEVSCGKQVSSPVKVVVERVEDFSVSKTFSSLKILPPLNMKCKEVPSHEVSSRSRRKTKSPRKRNAGDPKLPPFKGRDKRVQHMKTGKQHREVLLQDKLSESYGKCSKKRASEKPKALKCPSQNQSGTKNGTNDQVMDLTRQEAVSGSETASRDNPSPSLLPAASGRTSSKTKQTKSTNRVSEVIENDVAILEVAGLSKLSATGSQPEQILNSDTILDDMNTNKPSSRKCNISNSARSRQRRNNNLSPVCDKEQMCDIKSSKKKVASSHRLLNTIVMEVSGDMCGNGSSSSASNKVADEVTERSMPNSAEFLTPHTEMQETNKKFIKKNSRRSKRSSRSAKKDIQDMKIVEQNTLCKANVLKTDSDALRKDVMSTKQNISNSNDGFSDSLGEVLAERTCSTISETEATLPCVQTQEDSTSPHEVHEGSSKAADSEDVIESSQDSNSSLIASKLPLMQKCSVSVCRIDTTLRPGATISIPDGGSRHIVLTPDESGSPFKVYEDKPATPKQSKSAEALSGLEKAHGLRRYSAVRALTHKYADVTEMDSVQDKPSVSLGINPSRGESTEHPASECCVSEENRSRSEESISVACKEDTPKPQSMEEINASLSKDNTLVVTIKETLKQRADEKFSASELEDCILSCCKEPHSSQEINMSQSEDIVVKKEKESVREPCSNQQLSTGDSNENHLSSVKENSKECHSKQDINKLALEDTQLTAVRENVSKRNRKQPFNASNCDGHVLKRLKEEIPRPEPEQQRSETCGLTAAKEGLLKPRAREHTVPLKCEVVSLAEGLKARLKHDSTVTAVIPESEPEQQNTMLKPENKVTTVMKESAEKSELNSSNCEEITGMCLTDDTTELRPKHIGRGKRTKNSSRVKNYTSSRSIKLVLRSSSGRMLTEDEFMEDQPQQLVTPDSISTNQCQRKSDKQTKDDNVSSVGHNISSPLNQQTISDNSGVTDNTSGAKKTSLNESNILDGDFKVPLPVQSRKRRASREVPRSRVATTLDNPADARASKIKKLSVQNSEDGTLLSVCDRSVSAPSEVKLCDVASSDSDETISSPSSRPLVRSPSLLLRSFCSVLGSPESSERHKSNHKCLRGGRARYLVDCAGVVKDTGTWSDVRPEEIRSICSETQSSLPLPRTFHLYRMSGGGSSRLGT